MPAFAGVNAADVAVPVVADVGVTGRLLETKICVAHALSLYRRNSTVPAPAPDTGLERFDTVAVSATAPPTAALVAVVAIAGCAGATVLVSPTAPQAPLAGKLFVSPLKNARQKY
jgi:hypothetical protein